MTNPVFADFHRESRRTLPLAVVFLLGTLLALPFVLTLALHVSLSHDEHQHIAAGVLFAREGLVPYRDFAYFHVPGLVYLYGLLFRFTAHYFLATRLFSALCAALTGGAVFTTAWQLFPARPALSRLAIGVGALLLLLSAPVVYGTVGHSWNQEPSVLLGLLAFLALHRALAQPRRGLFLWLGGLLLGLAIGLRVTFAPLFLPFAILIWRGENAPRARLRALLTFAAATAVALLPVAWAALSAPAGFRFGNLEFPQLNIQYRMATGEPRTMTLSTKLRFFFKLVMRPNWALYYGFLATWAAACSSPALPLRAWPPLFLRVLLMLPFLLMGALAPSPVFDQYFYPLTPFLIIAALALLAGLPAGLPRLRWMWSTAAAVVLTATALAAHKYGDLKHLFAPKEWTVSELHEAAHKLRALVPRGRVLTLAGTLPLEAGLAIYPEFATGPFAWRIASFVAPERRAALRILAPDDLAARLDRDPPAAILLGFDSRWEEPLTAYAQTHGYRKVPLPGGRDLWLPVAN